MVNFRAEKSQYVGFNIQRQDHNPFAIFRRQRLRLH